MGPTLKGGTKNTGTRLSALQTYIEYLPTGGRTVLLLAGVARAGDSEQSGCGVAAYHALRSGRAHHVLHGQWHCEGWLQTGRRWLCVL